MLTPEYMKNLPDKLLEYFRELEDKILKDIIQRIDNIDDLSGTATNRIEAMLDLGYDIKDIVSEIDKCSKFGKKKIGKLIQDAGLLSYANDMRLYKVGGKTLKNYESNGIVKNLISSMQKLGMDDLENITQTLGFDGMPIKDYYRKKLSQSVIDINSGAFSKDEVIRKTINELGNSGIQAVNYKDRNYTLEAAVKMCVNTTVNKLSSAMGLINAEDMDQDLMELTAHMGARPSHADWQGKVVSRSGRDGYLSLGDIGYGEVTGFMGIHCRHNWYPFFEGISERTYTDEELKYYDPEPIEYDGKEYTYYEAGQRQRQLERSIRQSKRKLIMYEEVGDSDGHLVESVKLQRKRQEYKRFSNAMNIKENNENSMTLGYNRSKSSKAVWANRNAEKEANKLYNLGSTKANVDAYLRDKPIRDYIINEHPKKLNREKFEEHNLGSKRYQNNLNNGIEKSYLLLTEDETQQLINKLAGTGELRRDKSGRWVNKEFFTIDFDAGVYIDIDRYKENTNRLYITYNDKGFSHIVPMRRKDI